MRFGVRPARRWAAGALLLALPLSGWAKDPHLVVSGRVDVRDLTLEAPNLVAPVVNPDAGFAPAAPGAAASVPAPSAKAPAYAPVNVVAQVDVRQGDRVRAGQTLVRWDSRALEANAAAARSDVDVARTNLDVIDANLDDLDDKEADLNDKLDEVNEAIGTMSSKRRELLRTADDLRGKRAQADDAVATLTGKRAALSARLKQIDNDPGSLAQAREGLAKLDGGLAKAKAGQKKLAAAETKLNDGLGQLNSNLAKARSGKSQIEDGLTKIEDARTQLRRARTMADLAIGSADVGVRRADNDKSQATLVAPEDGVVVTAPNLGDTFAPGATVVALRPDRLTRVTTWLAPEQLAQICPGDGVQVSGDSAALSSRGNVVRLGPRADYPPTAQATDQVHLTRAVEVIVQVDASLPPGVPVDLSITPCQTVNQDQRKK